MKCTTGRTRHLSGCARRPHLRASSTATSVGWEGAMGDRSPKAKERNQKQKNTARADQAAAARSKQDAQKSISEKGKK